MSLNTGGGLLSSPCFGLDKRVYFSSINGKLYSYFGNNSLATSPWPMFQGGPRHLADRMFIKLDNGRFKPGQQQTIDFHLDATYKSPAGSQTLFDGKIYVTGADANKLYCQELDLTTSARPS